MFTWNKYFNYSCLKNQVSRGIEPRTPHSKCDVLPLYYETKNKSASPGNRTPSIRLEGEYVTITLKMQRCGCVVRCHHEESNLVFGLTKSKFYHWTIAAQDGSLENRNRTDDLPRILLPTTIGRSSIWAISREWKLWERFISSIIHTHTYYMLFF